MAKQRYISTSIWDDDWFVEELDYKEKLFYFYLLTNQYTNIAGIYKLSVRKMAIELNFPPTEIKNLLKSFENHNKVYYREQYIIMVNWPKHQKWQVKTTIHKGIRAILIKDIPDTLLDTITKEHIPYLYPIHTLSEGINKIDIPYTYPPSYIDKDLNLDSDFDSDFDSNKGFNKGENNEKHKYGEYKHVLLTDKEYEGLKTKVDDREKWIKILDESIQEKGNIYHIKDFNLAIQKWYKKELERNGKGKPEREIETFEAVKF